MLQLAKHWHGRPALSNHVCTHSGISMWHVICLQHLARACREQFRSTSVLPVNHVIQMPQCLSGFVNHDHCLISFSEWSYSVMRCMSLQTSIKQWLLRGGFNTFFYKQKWSVCRHVYKRKPIQGLSWWKLMITTLQRPLLDKFLTPDSLG